MTVMRMTAIRKEADMGRFSRTSIALILAGACLSAFAQFPFSLPGFGKGGDKGRGLDVGSIVNNLSKATRETDEPEEIRIGQEFAATLLGAKPLAADPALQ